MAREYKLEGSAVYNGMQDSEGGIWIRISNEIDRRIGEAAISKQMKNRDAATGTLTALDPNAGHLVDYVDEALKRIKEGFNGARPASAQLDGTPMAQAIAEGKAIAEGNASTPEKKARGKGKAQTSSAEIASLSNAVDAAAAALQNEAGDGIVWNDEVPKPRPGVGQSVAWASDVRTTITSVLGYRTDNEADGGAFEIVDSNEWHGFVQPHDDGTNIVEWRVVGGNYATPRVPFSTLDRLIEDAPAPLTDDDGSESISQGDVDAVAGAAAAAEAPTVAKQSTKKTPLASAAQRERNARNAGMRPVPKPSAAKKASSTKKRR